MKLTALLTLVALAIPAFAAEHNHEHAQKSAGPNGGRVIDNVTPKLEFYVSADRKVEITPLTDGLKPGKLTAQVIAVTVGERSAPTKMELQPAGDKLVSTNALPEGSSFPISVSIKADASSKAVYEKFNLNLAKCPECTHPEYACTCAH